MFTILLLMLAMAVAFLSGAAGGYVAFQYCERKADNHIGEYEYVEEAEIEDGPSRNWF